MATVLVQQESEPRHDYSRQNLSSRVLRMAFHEGGESIHHKLADSIRHRLGQRKLWYRNVGSWKTKKSKTKLPKNEPILQI